MTKSGNGSVGAVCFIALIKYVATWVAAFAEEITVIVMFSKNNYTLSAICSTLVL